MKSAHDNQALEAEIAAALQKDPDQPAYLAALAGLRLVEGKAAEASALLRRASALAPDDCRILNDLGVALIAEGAMDEAESVLGNGSLLWPENVDLVFNHARCLHLKQRPGEAYRKLESINALRADILKLRADVLKDLGKFDDALQDYLRLIDLEPANPIYFNDLGVMLEKHGGAEDRVALWEKLTSQDGASGVAFLFYGNALSARQEWERARWAYERAIEKEPSLAEAYNNLALILGRLGEEAAADRCLEEARRLNPSLAAPLANLGARKAAAADISESLELLRLAVQVDPDNIDARNNYGAILFRMRRLEEAEREFRWVLERAPGDPAAELNIGLLKLLEGRLEEGWPYYEARWKHEALRAKRPALSSPEWRGEPLDGKTLLVFSEQGFGDNLQMARYLLEIKRRYPSVRLVYLALHGLFRLMRDSLPAEGCTVLPWGAEIPEHDLHAPIMSLPWRCGTSLHTIPWPGRYLSANPELVRTCRKVVEQLPGLRVGVVWASSETFIYRSAKTLPLSALRPLFELPGVSWVNLQFGKEAAEIVSEGLAEKIADPMPGVQDFADTAAVVSSLDLIVSVDTAVAHLAGALDVPVWMLDRFDTDWRWLPPREDSPWYPNLRIFRQARMGCWEDVVQRVRDALATKIAGRPENNR